MLVIVGLIVFLVALVVGVAGVVSNAGRPHLVTDHFAVLGYHVTGSTGTVFLYGIVVGVVAMLGLSVLLAGARRTAARGRAARQELKESRREDPTAATAAVAPAVAPRDHDVVAEDHHLSVPADGGTVGDPGEAADGKHRRGLFGRSRG